jgi:hypothetical protein
MKPERIPLKTTLLECLNMAKAALKRRSTSMARLWLDTYRIGYAKAPPSTRRRWRTGK